MNQLVHLIVPFVAGGEIVIDLNRNRWGLIIREHTAKRFLSAFSHKLLKQFHDLKGDFVVLMNSHGVDPSFDLDVYPFHRGDPQRTLEMALENLDMVEDDAIIVNAIGAL